MAGKSDLKIIISAVDKASNVIDGVEKKASGLSGVFSAVGGAALKAGAVLAGAMVGTSIAIGKTVIDAMQYEGVVSAFESASAGMVGGNEAMLQAMRDASFGMVRDTELMKQYNLATQLLGQSFANELPDAMGAVAKVAAATGEDIGFLMDSYVRGIGRLSPMILDNLGIQVDLTSAYEEYANANGLVVAAMTKEQQQAALTARVNQMLLQNTEGLPEVAGTATQAWGAFQTQLANLKDTIGLQLIPAFTPLFGKMGEWITEYGPKLVGWMQDEGIPRIEEFLGVIEEHGPAAFELMTTAAEGLLTTLSGILSIIGDVSTQLSMYGDIVQAQPDIAGPGAYPGIYTNPENRPTAHGPGYWAQYMGGGERGVTPARTLAQLGSAVGLTRNVPYTGERVQAAAGIQKPGASEETLQALRERLNTLESTTRGGLSDVETAVRALPSQLAGRLSMGY